MLRSGTKTNNYKRKKENEKKKKTNKLTNKKILKAFPDPPCTSGKTRLQHVSKTLGKAFPDVLTTRWGYIFANVSLCASEGFSIVDVMCIGKVSLACLCAFPYVPFNVNFLDIFRVFVDVELHRERFYFL